MTGKGWNRNARVKAAAAVLVACLAATFIASAAFALDGLTLTTPGADKDLRAALANASQVLAAEKAKATDVAEYLAAAQGDYGRLLGALYAQGYYSGVIHILIDGVEAAAIAPVSPPARISGIAITVESGPRFVFSRAEVAPLAPGTVIPPRFAQGRIARSTVMQESVLAAIDQWRATGHAKARATGQEIVADHAAQTVAARFSLDPGPRLRFGPLSISGNKTVREDRIRAIAGYPEGAQFDPAALEKSAARLRRTGAFGSVTMREADAIGPGDLLAIEAQLAEAKPRRLGFGAEVILQEGLSLTGYWQHRNLLGGAEQFRIDGRIGGIGGSLSGVDYSLGARLTRPGTPDPDTQAYLQTRLEHQDEADFDADRASIQIGFNRVLSDHLTAEIGAGFAFERTTDILGTTNFSSLSVPLSITWDHRDQTNATTRGLYLAAGLTPFLGFNGTGTGARLTFDARAFQPLGGALVLAGRLQGGTVFASGLQQTPRDYLFYSGGGGTVRGQPFRSLGVSGACGTRGGAGCVIQTGGRSFLGLSGEVRTSLGKSLGLVAFADAGFISAGQFGASQSGASQSGASQSGSSQSGAGIWHSGAGIGLRYDTPIGPIRFDVAAPVSGPTGDGVQLYLGIGQAF